MNLVIDQGNTLNKIGIFYKGQLIDSYSCKTLDDKLFTTTHRKYNIKNIILSSVRDDKESISVIDKVSRLLTHSKLIVLNSKTIIPIKNEYKTPESLGKDRIAALVGAFYLFPNCPKLIIDAGTAITIDYLHADNSFKGGNISPGVQTRFKSLQQNTGKLPKLEINENTPFMGQNTSEAIWAGVQNSATFEIDAYINHFNTLNSKTKTILTGGDAYFFANNLKNRIFVFPNLVLSGLNSILDYNV